MDAAKWDGLTYLFTIPLGLLMAMVYGYTGLAGILLLFFSVLVLQFILRFYVRLQVANRELTAFYEVARFLEGSPGPAELLDFILKSVRRAFPYHTGVVYLRSGEKDTYLPAAVAGPYSEQVRSTAVYAGEGIIGQFLTGREPEIIFDSRLDYRTRDEAGLCQVLRSLLVVPLLAGEEALGVIVLGDKRPLAFDEKHLHIMAVLAGQAAVALENSILGGRLEQAMSRDNLTGLLNFTTFFELAGRVCEDAAGGGTAAGMVLMDIDGFAKFNRLYGRTAGEGALRELAALVEGFTRRGDLAARYGGDEFVLLLPGVSGPRLLGKAETLWEEIRGHVFLRGEGRVARLTVSIGVAEFPRDAGDAAGLLQAAQRALEKARAGGGDRVDTAAARLVDGQ
ncbi:MAG: sensor domain-containing diguanylate cyclase [Peptococcaceae bacterium]|nr:sensor domain-containing diguanylate cyclase [Peptococcaceae bacterium]